MKICLLMLGKTRRPEMVAALGEYVKRVSRSCPIEVVEVRDAAAGLKRLDANRAAQNGWESSGIAGFAR
jgi:23S rRNA pseudoU1915 N3-methylase RlmH